MLRVDVPGFGTLNLDHLVLDYNGTVARDGIFRGDLAVRLFEIAKFMKIYVVTADTFGTARKELETYPVTVEILTGMDHTAEKQRFVEKLGAKKVAAVGNGNNDAGMLQKAEVGIAVTGEEGCAVSAANSADILCASIEDALELFINKDRLKATLRR